MSVLNPLNIFLGTEHKRDKPDARERYYSIYYTAEQSALSAANPCDNIKIEKTDATPVKRTDYSYNQRDSVNHHYCEFPFCFLLKPEILRSHLFFAAAASFMYHQDAGK